MSMSVYLPIGREDGGRDSSKRFNTRRPKLNQNIYESDIFRDMVDTQIEELKEMRLTKKIENQNAMHWKVLHV